MVGFAAPAQAQQQVLEGVYNYHQEGVAEAGTWTIYPVCVPVVGDLRAEIRDPVACILHVSGTPTSWVTGGDAKLTGGQWAYSVNKKDGLTCPDGSTAPTLTTVKFNTDTMSGTTSVAHLEENIAAVSVTFGTAELKELNAAVAAIPIRGERLSPAVLAATIETTPFTLSFREPLPIPVQQYPLYCEPGGLRRCF